MALPGVKTTILDRFYNLGRTDLPGGPVIAIIAKRDTASTATAPDLEPYYAAGEQDVIREYGDGSYIHRGYREATTAGASRIVLIPLPANATFNHNTGVITSAGFAGNVFDAAFDSAEAIRADVIVPWGAGSDSTVWDDQATPATPGGTNLDYFYADNTAVAGNSWAKKVADRCATITSEAFPCFAVMGVKPFAGLESTTATQLATGVALPNLVSKETLTTGQFLVVVATEVRPISYPSSWGWSNGAVSFASLAVRLDPWRALTGKPLYNVDRMRYNPTRVQVESLNNKGVVSAAVDYSGGMKWVDATTFAALNSDFSRLTTLRIAFDAVKCVLSVSEIYKGENMSLSTQNAFETQISSKLRAMQQVGALNNSDFRITYVPSANQALIDLAITPAFELREIVLTLSINF